MKAKCELCNADVSNEKCAFADYKKIINGKEVFFCCQQHAKEYSNKPSRNEL